MGSVFWTIISVLVLFFILCAALACLGFGFYLFVVYLFKKAEQLKKQLGLD
jgi:ABC-type Na+ efflux pump permease subunit